MDTFTGDGVQLEFFLHPNPATFQFDPDKTIDLALTAGAGLRGRFAFFDLTPEVRYLHWTSAYLQPVRDQAMLLLTISFPAKN